MKEHREVYVGYVEWTFEGCESPEVVFSSEEQAKAWTVADAEYKGFRKYKSLVLQ